MSEWCSRCWGVGEQFPGVICQICKGCGEVKVG
jgi:hypothetical protein